QVFRLLILIGSGTGLVLLLRWFWWRINAWAELTALTVGVALAGLVSFTPALAALTFGQRVMLTTFGSLAAWLPVMWLTAPERAEILDVFYTRTRPGGWWGPVRARTGVEPVSLLRRDLLHWAFWVVVILGATLLIGWLLLHA